MSPRYSLNAGAGKLDTPPELAVVADPIAYEKGVPYSAFARLRREFPVAWILETPTQLRGATGTAEARGSGFWAVTRHETVILVSRNSQAFSSAARGAFFADPKSPADLERNRQLLINMDAPEHAMFRRLVHESFSPRGLAKLHQNIRMHAENVVNRALSAPQFDVVKDIAAELSLLVLADLLGIERKDRELIFKWSNTIVGFEDPEYGGGDVRAYQAAFQEVYDYARALAVGKRRSPPADLSSVLARSEIGGRPLTDREFCSMWIMLAIGGNESTRHLISGALHALVEWPEQRSRLGNNPGLIANAVEEFLRWVTPIMQFRRTALKNADLEGQKIKAGDKLILYYVSANRDESAFDRPDELDLGRDPNPHLAFGTGPHFCLGAHLARLETAALIEVLQPNLNSFELTGPIVRLKSNFMNGIKSMPARFNNKAIGPSRATM